MDAKTYVLTLELDGEKHSIALPNTDDEVNVTSILEISCYLFKKIGAKIIYEPFGRD